MEGALDGNGTPGAELEDSTRCDSQGHARWDIHGAVNVVAVGDDPAVHRDRLATWGIGNRVGILID